MRFREIKPILREFVDAGTSTNVSSLDDIKDLVVDNPEVATEVNQILKDIMARMPSSKQQAQAPQQQTQEPQQNQVQQTTQPKVERPNIRQPNSAPVQNTQNKTQDLPPGSPVQEQLAGQEAQPAQSANATRSKISVDQALLTIDDFGEELADYTPEQQAKILALVNKKINEKVAPKIELAKKQGGEEKEKEIITRTKEFKEIAKKLARDKGMNDDWGLKIYGIITEFEKNFGEKFLKHINDGTALIQPWSTITEQPMNKINLRNVVNPELKELFDTENSKPFMALKSEPFSVSTGQGSGSGPGETLLALLVPGATRAGKGDLDIDGGMWEVKGGSYTVKKNSLGQSNAWLDCSSIKASGLRAKFTEVMQKYLSKYWNKKITTTDGTVLTLSDLSRLADFRPSSIWALSYLFKQLRPEQRYSVLEELYDEIFPTLKKKYPKPFDSAIRLSAEAIMVQDTKDTLSDVQARLAMLEYMAGPYNAKGIVVFNKTTDEMMVIQGIKGINTAMKTNTLSTQTMTMQGKGDTKAHPGIFLTAPREEIEPQLGIIRTKPHKPKVRKIRESD